MAEQELEFQSSQNAELDKKSVCAEMAEEMQFAMRCHGSKKPARKKHSIIGKHLAKHCAMIAIGPGT